MGTVRKNSLEEGTEQTEPVQTTTESLNGKESADPQGHSDIVEPGEENLDPLTGKPYPKPSEMFDLSFYNIVSQGQQHRFTKIFNDLDADGDKTLTPDEVYEGLRACNDPNEKASFLSEATQTKLRYVMKVLNLEENPVGVDVNEFVLAMTLSERLGGEGDNFQIEKLIDDIKRFRELYKASDSDCDGVIGYDDMQVLLASAGLFVSAQEAQQYITRIQLPCLAEESRTHLQGLNFLDFLSHAAFFLMLNKQAIRSSNIL